MLEIGIYDNNNLKEKLWLDFNQRSYLNRRSQLMKATYICFLQLYDNWLVTTDLAIFWKFQ